MKHTFEIEEEDRQMILLAIAELALSRPGWDATLTRMAGILNGKEMFERFKNTSEDRITAIQPDARILELCERLTSPGSIAGKLSASEHHEMVDFILGLVKDVPAPAAEHHITVNGMSRTVPGDRISYQEVAKLANKKPGVSYSITYCRGLSPKYEGIMGHDDVVALKDGMIFNVVFTGNA